MKARSKKELYIAAGVSASTFRKWLKNDEIYLRLNGVSPNARIFPPKVAEYICRKYCIDL